MKKIKGGLIIVKRQTTMATAAAEQLSIRSANDEQTAADLVTKIRTVKKFVLEEKKKRLDPEMEKVKQIRAFFAPFEQRVEEAEQIILNKLSAYRQKIAEKTSEKIGKIIDRADDGKISAETANKKIADLVTAPQKVETKVGSVQYQTRQFVEIEDLAKIPREYLVPDMPKINEVALRQGKKIPGVKVVTKEISAVHTNHV